MKNITWFIICVFLLSCNAYGQEITPGPGSPGLKKNALYGTLGIDFSEFYINLLGNYERVIFEPPHSFVQSFRIRVGAGPWVWWSGKGFNYVSTLSILTGRKASHLEIGAGLVFTYNSLDKEFNPLVRDRYMAGNIAYRYQKPGGNLVFRTGIGWPEFTFLGIGTCF